MNLNRWAILSKKRLPAVRLQRGFFDHSTHPCSYGTTTLGIRSEDKNIWESRTPLPPVIITKLLEFFNKNISEETGLKEGGSAAAKIPSRLQVIVQPCRNRVYTDSEYQKVVHMYCSICHCLMDNLSIGWCFDNY